MKNRILHVWRQIIFAFVLLVPATLLPLAAVYPAEASFAFCRGDPILKLDKGLQVTFTVQLNIAASRVVAVVYTVHAPKNVILKQIQYPKDDLTGKESVIFLHDSPDSNFHVTTVAHVLRGSDGTVLVTGINKKIVVTAAGVTEQPINVSITAVKQ